jgi:hypothetical protein
MYDAVNAIDGGHQSYLLDDDALEAAGLDPQPWFSRDAAAATAAHHVLVALAPARQGVLDGLYTTTLGAITDAFKAEGVAVGAAAADAMLDERDGDGFMAAFSFTIGLDSGNWRPVGFSLDPPAPGVRDPDPWVGSLKPFLIESPDQFRSKGPNRLSSKAYAKDFAEVKELGALDSATRTDDQTTAAVFWQFAPIALWNQVARDQLAARYELDAADEARLYAMVNLAAADAAISCWNDKYYWNFWRPRAAIREAEFDGNPDTVGEPAWEALFAAATVTSPALATPPFPDHPSGHGCLSGAVLETMTDFFGRDKIEFDVVSGRTLDGHAIPPRHFERFSDAIDEVIDARVWGGIHFRTADEQGARIGEQVAHWLHKHEFRKLH